MEPYRIHCHAEKVIDGWYVGVTVWGHDWRGEKAVLYQNRWETRLPEGAAPTEVTLATLRFVGSRMLAEERREARRARLGRGSGPG